MTFREQLVITIVDKLVIGLVVAVVAFLFNRLLETFRSEQAKLLRAFEGQQSLALETFRSQRSLENELTKLRESKKIEYLDKQLSQFYWPIYIRLHIDTAVWEKILDKRKK